MPSDLVKSLHIAASGMKVQSDRLRMVSENIANAESIGTRPGEAPYRRKVMSFENELDRKLEAELVKVHKRGYDDAPFRQVYKPSHPMANDDGYVLYPNVNSMIEMMDMREARRGYEANLNVIETSKGMVMQTINLLR